MDLRDMRATLMARYEPTSKVAREIDSRGIEEVFQSIPLTERADLAAIYLSLKDCGGELLIPEDARWPSALNELEIPPIGLIVKGDVETLSRKSLAIVGTRNPTPY
jgi:predicted Rossmann fold nucleotide-binding protein DprA/Smf involved in DNA uptake